MEQVKARMSWQNQDNADFYSQIPLSILQDYAKLAGLDHHDDLQLILPQLLRAQRILEVGAGFGRVIHYLRTHSPQAEIFAVERNKRFITLLQQQYEHDIHLIHSDILQMEFTLDVQVELILWLWGGLAEFAQAEQLTILKKLRAYLAEKGMMIIDTMPVNLKPINATAGSRPQHLVFKADFGELHGYMPTHTEIEAYAEALNCQNIQHIPYVTHTQREHTLHLLSF
jgi:SAM-dependent methyltransferase